MSELDTIRRIRATYPTPLGAKHARFLDEVCLALRAFMFEKNAGDHTTLPNGKNVSLDIIISGDRSQWIDILWDAEGAAVPAWSPNPNPTGVFVDPLPLSAFDGITPPPPNPPPAPPVDLSDILRRLTELEQELRDLRIVPRKYSIQTVDGHFLCAENGGGGDVNATRTNAGPWETFTLEPK